MNRRVFLAAGGAVIGLPTIFHAKSLAPSAPDSTVKVSAFGSDAAALQLAIDSGAQEILVDAVVTVLSDIRLRSDQTVRFAGGRLKIPVAARIAKGVLNGEGISGSVIVNPIIERLGDTGVVGIRLSDATDVRIEGGGFTRANLKLESYNGTPARRIVVSNLTINLASWQETAVWISGINGVTLLDVECSNGLEGVGIYNGAKGIRLTRVKSYDHTRDGFVVIAGQDITHDDCQSSGNGQSGFATQRQTSGENSRNIRWTHCKTWNNDADGFDMRGATDKPWGISTGFDLASCQAHDNRRCGFYVVMAEGTVLTDCTATDNDAQNLFIDNSNDVVVRNFHSLSGAATIASGPNKAGILVYDSQFVWLDRPLSRNEKTATQDFGISLTGKSNRNRLTGGTLSNNNIRSIYAAVNTLGIK